LGNATKPLFEWEGVKPPGLLVKEVMELAQKGSLRIGNFVTQPLV